MSSYTPQTPTANAGVLAAMFGYCPNARFTGLISPAFFLSFATALTFGLGAGCTWDYSFTLCIWLTQCLSANKSCSSAVHRAAILCCSLGRPICSACTGAFCKARAKISAWVLSRTACSLGRKIRDNAESLWKWKNHNLVSVDGVLLRMQDTPENLARYPLQKHQTPGTGFCRMRLVTLFCLATGVLLAAAYAAYSGKGTGEMSLLLQLLPHLNPSDILIGDRYYGSYALVAQLQKAHTHCCFRMSSSLKKHFGEGQLLGEDDFSLTWSKPQKSKNVDSAFWDALPEQIVVRVLRFTIIRRGYRPEEIYVVTTLTDHVTYTKEDIADLYLRRWTVEVDLRTLKQTLKMSQLSCKTPDMVEAEVWTHLLGYNLVRCAMAQAALDMGYAPRQLSFSNALSVLNESRWLLSSQTKTADEMRLIMAGLITACRVGNRPGRYEPRETKKKERKYPELKKDRKTRREELPDEYRAENQEEKQGKPKAKKDAGKNKPISC